MSKSSDELRPYTKTIGEFDTETILRELTDEEQEFVADLTGLFERVRAAKQKTPHKYQQDFYGSVIGLIKKHVQDVYLGAVKRLRDAHRLKK